MGDTEVVFYQEDDGDVPLLEWLDGLETKPREKCLARLARLEALGHELRRPEADYLRDEICELRAAYQGVQYRMLYFFSGKAFVVVSHGLVKEKKVPSKEIDRAVARKERFEADPEAHTFEERIEMAEKKRRKFRSRGLQYAYDRYVGEDSERSQSFEDELLNARIASQIYDLRTQAELSQRQLAERVGTTASVICRLEDADYDGHSLSMLRRIAEALDKQIEIRFVSKERPA